MDTSDHQDPQTEALDWSRQVGEIVSPYDPLDLLISVAALQLSPKNAAHALRLEALANVATALPRRNSKPKISPRGLRRICNESSPLNGLRRLEDPSEQAFTQTFTFIGGSYVVFPGIVDDAVFVLQHLAWAIVEYKERWPGAFFRAAAQILGAGLTVSDVVAKRAGLTGGVAPLSRDRQIHVPAPAEMRRLKQAVQVDYEGLERALDTRGFGMRGLESLMIAPAETPLKRGAPMSGPLDSSPIVRVDDSAIAAAPGLLLAAMRHAVICLAQRYGISDVLADRYRLAVWHAVKESLDLLDHEPLNLRLPHMSAEMSAVDGVFSMDTDKALYVSLVTDDLQAYDGSEVFGTWECPGLDEQLDYRQEIIEEFLVQDTQGLNEIIVLHLIAGAGRSYCFGLGSSPGPMESPRLLMTAPELEVIAMLERGNRLLLREYAIASTSIREHAQVVAYSALDEFAIYRDRQYSYYLDDEARPDVISVKPGTGLDLRLQAIDEFDRHSAPAPGSGYYVEVIQIEPNYEMPIYTPVDSLRTGNQVALLVERLPVGVWIIGPEYDEEPDQRELGRLYLMIADTIAYWTWQFSSSLVPLLDSLRQDRVQNIVFELRASPDEPWFRSGRPVQQDDQPIAEYRVVGNTVLLQVNPTLVRALETPDNQGERALMSVVLRAMNEIATDPDRETRTISWDIQTMLDKHAPLGLKKKALILDADTNPGLSTTGLPTHRAVQMGGKTHILDEVGTYLERESGVPVGPISKEDRTRILREVVEFLYQRLCSLVSSVRSEFLLEWLIRYHEAIRHDMSHFALTLPTRLACFFQSNDFNAKVAKDLQELREAGQTARFIIEYVSAQPPDGLRPISLSVYDELQALGSEIISWASLSDLINYGIADIDLWMLPSGRLGTNYRTLVREGSQTFLHLHSSEQIDRATTEFGRHWPAGKGSSERTPSRLEEIDRAFKAEYGYTLTELTSVMADCFALGAEQRSPVKSSAFEELGYRLCESTGYPHSRVERILEDLSLSSRADFLKPETPFRKEDVYPWRFGRPLSYMRRPLVRTAQDEGPLYIWGNLHLHDSINYIVDMCLSGRLQARATSQELRSLLARFNQERGSAFTDRVFKVFDGYGSLVADSNLKKIGKERIAKDGDDLGDIDALVINPRRRKVLVAECKDLSIARIPYEMANELETLFEGNDPPATVDRHQRRTEWIEANLPLVLEHYGVETEGAWQVEPVLIIDEEMLTPHIYESPMAVISFRTLVNRFVEEWV